MPARTRAEDIAELQERAADVSPDGERLKNGTAPVAPRQEARTLLRACAIQHDPSSGAVPYYTPRTMQDLERRRG